MPSNLFHLLPNLRRKKDEKLLARDFLKEVIKAIEEIRPTGYAFVAWNNDGGTSNMYNAGTGNIPANLIPSYAHDELLNLQTRVRMKQAEEEG